MLLTRGPREPGTATDRTEPTDLPDADPAGRAWWPARIPLPGVVRPLGRAFGPLGRAARRTAAGRDAVLVGSVLVGAVAGVLLGAGLAPWQLFGRTVLSGSWWWDRTVALQSTGLLVLVGLGTLVAVLVTAAAGRRPAPPGWRSLGRRAGALVGCQLLGVLLLGLAVNDSFDFYSSWNDLLGTGSGGLVATGVGLTAPTGPGGAPAPLADHRFTAPDPGTGRLVNVTATGERTGLTEDLSVYLPPQYDEPGAANRRFPAVLALTGYPGSLDTIVKSIGLPAAMKDLVRQGRVAPMVVVMARSTVAPPRDTECTDIPGGPQAETFFAQDLPAWVGAHFRVQPPGHWGVLGVSTGGFCAAKLLLAHPEVFRAGVSVSGYLSPVTDITTGDLFAGNIQLQHLNDPYWRIRHLPRPPVSLLLTATRQEHGVYPQVVRFLHAARPPLQTASIIRATGGHNATVWRSELPLCLQWLSARL